MKENDGEGFAIVALHCSLIEFLRSMETGKSYINGVVIDSKTQYNRSNNEFRDFLTSATPFRAMFAGSDEALDFYTSVRCGLLHEARTKGPWLIKVDPGASQAIDSTNKIIYRNAMQRAFDAFIEDYGMRLGACTDLQDAFIRRFEALCSP